MTTEHRPIQLALEPTNAMLAGEEVVDQCSWCGTLVAHEVQHKLGRCPACNGEEWWRQSLPVGPFRVPGGKEQEGSS